MENTGIEESQIQQEMRKTYSQCTVKRLKRGDNTPMKVLKISGATEEHANQALHNRIYLGNLWIQSKKETRVPKVKQCYKSLNSDTFPQIAQLKNDFCKTCAEKRHAHKRTRSIHTSWRILLQFHRQ